MDKVATVEDEAEEVEVAATGMITIAIPMAAATTLMDIPGMKTYGLDIIVKFRAPCFLVLRGEKAQAQV